MSAPSTHRASDGAAGPDATTPATPIVDVLVAELGDAVLDADPLALLVAPDEDRWRASEQLAALAGACGRAAVSTRRPDLLAKTAALVSEIHHLGLRGALAEQLTRSVSSSPLMTEPGARQHLFTVLCGLPDHPQCAATKLSCLVLLARAAQGDADLVDKALRQALRTARRCGGLRQLAWVVAESLPQLRARAAVVALVEALADELIAVLRLTENDLAPRWRARAVAACAGALAPARCRELERGGSTYADVRRDAAALFAERVMTSLLAEHAALDAAMSTGSGPHAAIESATPALQLLRAVVAGTPGEVAEASEDGHTWCSSALQVLHFEQLDLLRDLERMRPLHASMLGDWLARQVEEQWLAPRRAAIAELQERLRAAHAELARPSLDISVAGATPHREDPRREPGPLSQAGLAAIARESEQTPEALARDLRRRLEALFRGRLAEAAVARLAAYLAEPERIVAAARFVLHLERAPAASAAAQESLRDAAEIVRPTPRDAVIHLFWSGGYDSTFRLCQLLIDEQRPVQPVCIAEPGMDNLAIGAWGRRSLTQEREARQRITDALAHRFPHTRELLRSPLCVSGIRLDRAVKKHTAALINSGIIRRHQYTMMAQVCRDLGRDIEVGVENSSHSRMLGIVHDRIAPDPTGVFVIVDTETCPDLVLFRRFRFPIINLTKQEMLVIGTRGGYDPILRLSWSCWFPKEDGQPCGACPMCRERIV